MQITYEDGGPSYHTNDYFPHLHFQAAAALADQDYDLLIDWGIYYKNLKEINISEAVEFLSREGAADDIRNLNLR